MTLRIVFHAWSVPSAQKYFVCGSFFNQARIVPGTHHFPLEERYFTRWHVSRRTAYFHCRIVFHTRIVPGTPQWRLPFADRLFYAMKCSRRTTYFQSRIAFHTRIVSRTPRISTWLNDSLRIASLHDELFELSGATKILKLKYSWIHSTSEVQSCQVGGLFSWNQKTKRFRQAPRKIFHLRIDFSTLWLVSGARQNIPFKGSLFMESKMKCFRQAPRKVFHLRIAFQPSTNCSRHTTFSTWGSLFYKDDMFHGAQRIK